METKRVIGFVGACGPDTSRGDPLLEIGGQATPVSNHIVIRQHPGAGPPNAPKSVKRFINYCAQISGVPGGGEIAEIEGLVHLVWSDIPGHFLQRHDPGFSTQHPVWTIFVENFPPIPINVVDTILVPKRFGVPDFRVGHNLSIRQVGFFD